MPTFSRIRNSVFRKQIAVVALVILIAFAIRTLLATNKPIVQSNRLVLGVVRHHMLDPLIYAHEIYAVSSDGSGRVDERIPNLSGEFAEWPSDKQWIVYNEFVDNYKGAVKIMRSDGLQYCGDPQWSPDGERIAFGCSSGKIYVMNADGSNTIAIADGGEPQWSPNGQRIAFVSSQDGLGRCIAGTCGSGGVYTNAIFMLNVDGGNLVRASLRDDESVRWYTWVP
jgi:Tol biopolymer transport system component